MNSCVRPKLRIVVLAAGFSTRLGQSKPLARVRGVSLLGGTIRLLAPLSASRIVVVIPPRAVRVRAELRGRQVTLDGECAARRRTVEFGTGAVSPRRATAPR